jgi:hypothetical protein
MGRVNIQNPCYCSVNCWDEGENKLKLREQKINTVTKIIRVGKCVLSTYCSSHLDL